MTFVTTTPKGTEGFNISYSDEAKVAKALKKFLPKGWTIHFQWAQILFTDVQYHLNAEKKVVDIVYNQNLMHWLPDLAREIEQKIKTL